MKCIVVIVLMWASALHAQYVNPQLGLAAQYNYITPRPGIAGLGAKTGYGLSSGISGAVGAGAGVLGSSVQALANGALGVGSGLINGIGPGLLEGLQGGMGAFAGLNGYANGAGSTGQQYQPLPQQYQPGPQQYQPLPQQYQPVPQQVQPPQATNPNTK